MVGCALLAALGAAPAHADRVSDEAAQLGGARSFKRRLAAVLALSKAPDPRAVLALTRALGSDADAQIRRSAAVALAATIDEQTPQDTRDAALAMLTRVARADRDPRVRELCAQSLQRLDEVRLRRPAAPELFVLVHDSRDHSRRTSAETRDRLTHTVRKVVDRAPEVSIDWAGGLPTMRELAAAGTHGFVVTTTVSGVEIAQTRDRADIRCSVAMQISPWSGADGNERWRAGEAANASGTGRATTGTSSAQIAAGIRDCVLAVGEQVTTTKVVPFLKRFAHVTVRD